MAVFAQFVFFCLTSNSSIMHTLPLPPYGLYNTRAQNGYGQHRRCKIVLLTPVTPRGGIHRPIPFMRDKYRTRANGLRTMKLVELSTNNHIADLIHKHHITNGL